MRRDLLKMMFAAGLFAAMPNAAAATRRFVPLDEDKLALTAFHASAFPYHGVIPETDEPFMNVVDKGRLGHQSLRGGIRWEDDTYSDRRTLNYLPSGFSLAKPAAIVVYFHGNDATLERDVMGVQRIPAQIAQSGINAALVAPQLAFDARDSSAGNFWREGFFASYLKEAAVNLAKLYGQQAVSGDFDRLPVIVAAFSGGYYPAVWSLQQGGAARRIAGVMLFDALFGDADKFAAWTASRRRQAFLFSSYSTASKKWNLQLEDMLAAKGIGFSRDLPQALKPGNIHFTETAEDVDHVAFMSQAWTADPLDWSLQRVKLGKG